MRGEEKARVISFAFINKPLWSSIKSPNVHMTSLEATPLSALLRDIGSLAGFSVHVWATGASRLRAQPPLPSQGCGSPELQEATRSSGPAPWLRARPAQSPFGSGTCLAASRGGVLRRLGEAQRLAAAGGWSSALVVLDNRSPPEAEPSGRWTGSGGHEKDRLAN